MPFYMTDHRALLEALQVLNPGIRVPSAHKLANQLLDSSYDKYINRLTTSLAGRVVTLETDAWTDINGMSVINYMAVSENLFFFLESNYTGEQSHNTPFLAADVKRVLLKYRGIKFGGVITDSTTANKAMWEEL
ncbi:hypothetical protein PPTG_06830 [Phytophthora nicotianae INRA-310]|uniref:DUF659 domain-containing protein n=1 Tax=Phytophthora nicotianae (strain INRA-310) TaxID=761204 RepID=W2QRJ8_PHYN3|nr:hypothetical protein PPTG_06830 [Phytophthora nicotianae INRA-310]ETN15586.1 hypothetical protein PPTG_06830 [Phytophthora nicotianae INRA-310]